MHVIIECARLLILIKTADEPSDECGCALDVLSRTKCTDRGTPIMGYKASPRYPGLMSIEELSRIARVAGSRASLRH